jgi:hypothetical protein
LNSTELLDVLTMHVVAGEFPASAVIAAGCVELTTLGGTMVGVSYSEANGVMINGATVIRADLTGEGGIMHGIDSVLLGEFTPCPETVFEAIAAFGNYSTLLGALESTGADVIVGNLGSPVSKYDVCIRSRALPS